MTATPDFSIRMQVAGMRGLLSEIIAVGALSKHGDADLMERVREAADTPLPELPTRSCLAQIEEPAQPVLYVSPGQLANHSNPEGPESEKAGRYLPARVTPAGKFTQPLYAGEAPATVEPRARDLLGIVRTAQAEARRLINGEDSGSDLAQTKLDLPETLRVLEHALSQPAAVAGSALDVTLDEDQADLLRDMLGDPAEYEEALTVRLIVCDGHSGHGLYVAQAEYQDEGAVLLTALPAPAAPALEAPAAASKCAQCKKAYKPGSASVGCPKCAPGVQISEAEFQKPLAAAPQAPAAPAEATEAAGKAHDWRDNASYGGETCAECGATKGSRRGNAPCTWPPAKTAKRWPFLESPGEFTARLEAAIRSFGGLLPAVRNVLIEHPPTLAAAPAAPSVDERAAYVEFLAGKFPQTYSKEDAEHWWDHGHVSALTWQAARAVAAAPAAPAVDARAPIKPQHPKDMTSVNARLSFNHGWTAAERAHGIRPAAQAAAKGEHDE